MSFGICLSVDFGKSLEEDYVGVEVPLYKLRKWFSEVEKVFFDCDGVEKVECLKAVLERDDFSDFVVFLIVKQEGSYQFMDIVFRNLGTETLKHFIKRYETQLSSMTKLSFQSRKIEYIKAVGYSYN